MSRFERTKVSRLGKRAENGEMGERGKLERGRGVGVEVHRGANGREGEEESENGEGGRTV